MKNNTHEKQIYNFIVEYLARNHFSPSVKEIAEHIGTSTGNTWRYLTILRARGLLDWRYKRTRSIQVIAPFK